MSASVILTSLPRDAHAALQRAEQSPTLPPSGAGVAGSVGGKQKRLEGVDEQGSAAPKKGKLFSPIHSYPIPISLSYYLSCYAQIYLYYLRRCFFSALFHSIH